MSKIELTNMVMVQDQVTNKVLVQDRIKNWKGITFPGGHVEEGESFVDSAIREVKEETGLDIKNLKLCGIIHWYNNITSDRYIEFLYKTTDFSGELLNETAEGKIFWTDIESIYNLNLSNNFQEYLPMFLEGKYSEAFGEWNEEQYENIIYK